MRTKKERKEMLESDKHKVSDKVSDSKFNYDTSKPKNIQVAEEWNIEKSKIKKKKSKELKAVMMRND